MFIFDLSETNERNRSNKIQQNEQSKQCCLEETFRPHKLCVLFSIIIIRTMLNERISTHHHEGWQKEIQQHHPHYYSVNPARSQQQEPPSKGRLIRNQLVRNKDITHQKQHHRTLTPQPHKQEVKQQGEATDVQSFKLEESKLNSKYLTAKKDVKEKGSEETKKGVHSKYTQKGMEKEAMGSGTISLNEGWTYKGQYNSGLFHGFGELIYREKTIYKGRFQFGYFHGHGQLNYCEIFSFLVPLHSLKTRLTEHLHNNGKRKGGEQLYKKWTSYLGEFQHGQVSGYGQLRLESFKIVGCWQKGRIGKHFLLLASTHQSEQY